MNIIYTVKYVFRIACHSWLAHSPCCSLSHSCSVTTECAVTTHQCHRVLTREIRERGERERERERQLQ